MICSLKIGSIIKLHVSYFNRLTSFCIGDPFNEIENEFLTFSLDHDYICLVGDFNSRTSRDADYLDLEYDEFSGMLDIENTCVNTLESLDLPNPKK